jgi:hypothetical protein
MTSNENACWPAVRRSGIASCYGVHVLVLREISLLTAKLA